MEVVLSEAESLFAQNMPQKEKQTDSIGKIFPNKQKTAHNANLINSHKEGNISLYRGWGAWGEPEIWGEKSQKTLHREYIPHILKLVHIFMMSLHLAHLAYHLRFYSEYFCVGETGFSA